MPAWFLAHHRELQTPDLLFDQVRTAGFSHGHVEPLTVEWGGVTFEEYWERESEGLRPWPDAAFEAATRARVAEVVARWTGTDGLVRFPVRAYAVVALAE